MEDHFDEKLVVEQELEEQKLKNEVEVLRKEVQKTEGVWEHLTACKHTEQSNCGNNLLRLRTEEKYPEVS